MLYYIVVILNNIYRRLVIIVSPNYRYAQENVPMKGLLMDIVCEAGLRQPAVIRCRVKRPLLRSRLPVPPPAIDLNSGIDRVLSSLKEARVGVGHKQAGLDSSVVSYRSIRQMSLTESGGWDGPTAASMTRLFLISRCDDLRRKASRFGLSSYVHS